MDSEKNSPLSVLATIKNSFAGSKVAAVFFVFGFMLSMQFRAAQTTESGVQFARMEELTDRLIQTEKERDSLQKALNERNKKAAADEKNEEMLNDLRFRTALTGVKGEGVIVKMDDSKKSSRDLPGNKSGTGENANLYIIHDDDLLRVINELRAAGAEAVAVNGQRLTGTSEIRCAGPTLSVNNERSGAPFTVAAIGNKETLESALKMRGGVAETLNVWGITLDITASDDVYVPPYKGVSKREYVKETVERD